MSHPQQSPRELAELLDGACNGDLSPQEWRRLDQRLQSDPAARGVYLDHLSVEAELYASQAARSGHAVISSTEASRGGLLKLRGLLAIAASLIGVAALSSLATLGLIDRHAPSEPAVASVDSEPATVARISATRNCRWSGTATGLGFGAPLQAGQRITLEAGVAEIAFHSGATVLLEGPASLTIEDARAANLVNGRLSAKIPSETDWFMLRTGNIGVGGEMPPAQAAEFGLLSGGGGGGGGEVHVFDGSVNAFLTDTSGSQIRTVQLKPSEAARVRPSSTTVSRIHANHDHFIRSLSAENGPHDGLYAYEGFDYPVGPLSWQNGGFGWAGPWADIEVGDAGGEATNLVAEPTLGFDGMRSIGNQATQTGNANRIRRVLSTSIGGVFDAAGLVENRDGHRLVGKEGSTVYISFLQRVNKTNDVFYGFELNRGDGNGNRVLCVGNGAEGAGYGVTSNYNDYGPSNYPPLGKEDTADNLIVIRIDFKADDRDQAFVFRNPRSLMEESRNGVMAELRGNFAFDRISLGNFEGEKVHEIDEIRVGTTFRSVTGQRDHLRDSRTRPLAMLQRTPLRNSEYLAANGLCRTKQGNALSGLLMIGASRL